jgi:hypothetical protein
VYASDSTYVLGWLDNEQIVSIYSVFSYKFEEHPRIMDARLFTGSQLRLVLFYSAI